MDKTLVSLRGLRRSYALGSERVEVLRGCDLDLEAGDGLALVSPSGSGKSTFLHAVGLLEKPDGGEIRLGGHLVSELRERDRTRLRCLLIGFVYQFHHLISEFSAWQNVALPLRLAGRDLRAARERAFDLLGRMGLENRLEHRPSELSGGEKQRVAIARAMANGPQLLLADEPTGNLDAKAADLVFSLLDTVRREEGMALIVATHNVALAARLPRRMCLSEGLLSPLP